jgi:hypothetical protein
MKGRDHLGYLGKNWRIALKLALKKWDMSVWIGFIWLRIGFSGGLL